MKKIGLVTYYKNNFGSALQCYATKTTVENMGYLCELLINSNQKTDKIYSKINRAKFLLPRFVFVKNYYKAIKEQSKVIKGSSKDKIGLTEKSIQENNLFINSVLKPRECSDKVLRCLAKSEEYVAFIAGSDQIWSGSWPVNPFYFLDFAPSNKKIALSASLGSEKIEQFNLRDFKKEIGSFRKVSLREDTAVSIVKNQLNLDAIKICDPTVLLDSNKWKEFASYQKVPKEKYLLLHFLDKPNEVALKTIEFISKQNQIKIVAFAYYHKEYENINNLEFIDGNPRDYVGLISESFCVCTDSFHTSVMSIYLEKNFCVFDRQYKHGKSQVSRINTILSHYHCEKNKINTFNSENILDVFSNTNWDDKEKIIESDRIEAYDYLHSSIKEIDNSVDNNTIDLRYSDCVGCGACVAICNKNAITLKQNANCTSIPFIDKEKCVSCRRCETVCRKNINQEQHKNFDKEAYIAYNKEAGLRSKSASGGIFSALASNFIENGNIVCGAAFCMDEKTGRLVLKHKIASTKEQLIPILKSKYVQSDCDDIYSQVAKELKNNKKVLFSGTSCQIDGIYRYLETCKIPKYNLTTVDLICHGTPDRQLFNDYLQFLEKKYEGEVIDFLFRKKVNGKSLYVITAKVKNNNNIKEVTIPMEKSSYYRFFMECENYRDECYYCKYSSINKPSDITLGDYFEAKDDYPQLFESSHLKGINDISCIIVHTDKGKSLLNNNKDNLYLYQVDVDKVQASHGELCKPHMYTGTRNKMLKCYNNKGYEGIEKYFNNRENLFKKSKKLKKLLGK